MITFPTSPYWRRKPPVRTPSRRVPSLPPRSGMRHLSEIQNQMRAAIVGGDQTAIAQLGLIGGRCPEKRFGIHRRHYETRLVEILMRRFPGVCWLMGSSFVIDAARDFVRRWPPATPCLAEYGDRFPVFLADRPGAAAAPYLGWFASLEWYVGRVALAIDETSLGLDALAAVEPDLLPALGIRPQTGLHYVAAPWPIDDLFMVHLCENQPTHFALEPGWVGLQIRGARGMF